MSKSQEIKLYGIIGDWENNGASFSNKLLSLESSGCKELIIRMHCYGGSVMEGNVIFNAIQRSKMKIKIIIDGIAASMASIIILAANEVEIAENGFVMVHVPTGSSDGNASTHAQTTKLLNDLENNFSKVYSSKSGLSIDQVKSKWFDGLDHWLNADEAVSYGFATRKIPAVTGNLQSLNKSDLITMNLKSVYGRYTALLSNSNNNEKEMKKELIEYFKLKGVTEESSDTAVLQLIKDHFEGIKRDLDELEKMLDAENKRAIKSMVSGALKAGKIYSPQCDFYEKLGITSGLDVLSTVLENFIKRPSIASMIVPEARGNYETGSGKGKGKNLWTLEDYRKYAPKELGNDSKLYNELVEKEFGKE